MNTLLVPFQAGCPIMIAGPTGSGKTFWTNKLLKNQMFTEPVSSVFRWFKFTLKPPYSIAHDKLRLAIWDTSFLTFWLKVGHKGP